jgi:DNA-binding transcriptional LysR family regulator
VLAGELNLGLLTAVPLHSQITAVPFARAPVYVILSKRHRVAQKEHVVLQDVAEDQWILFAKQLDPIVHDAIMEAALHEGIICKCVHDVATAEQAIHLVSEQLGVAILIQPCGVGFRPEGVVVKSLTDTSLWFESCPPRTWQELETMAIARALERALRWVGNERQSSIKKLG